MRSDKKKSIDARILPHLADVAAGAASFFRNEGRTYPWRSERSLYRLAIAEILLQKTRANSALPIYNDLVARYRSPEKLARADEDDLEASLRPIGLAIKRSRQLRGMAVSLVTEGENILRDRARALKVVPGLGAYAVRAIACFGNGDRVGIVDANVARILRRVFSVSSPDPRAVVYQHIADAVIDLAHDARESNFGLLDIGAAVCVRVPKCSMCPFGRFCARFEIDRSQ